MVVVVVPAFTEGDQGKQEAVPALVTGIVSLAAQRVREGIHRAGRMEEKNRADEKSPDNHLPPVGSQRRGKSSQHGTQKVKSGEEQRRPDEVEAIEEDQLRVFRQIPDAGVVSWEVAAAGEPADMRPKKTLPNRGVGIVLLIGVRVVVTVDRGPPQRAPLDRGQPEQGENELPWPGRLERAVTKVSMVNRRNRKHPDEIESDSNNHGHRAPANPDDAQTSNMKDEERNEALKIHFFRLLAGGFSPFGKIVGVDRADREVPSGTEKIHVRTGRLALRAPGCQWILFRGLVHRDADNGQNPVEIPGPIVLDSDRTTLFIVI